VQNRASYAGGADGVDAIKIALLPERPVVRNDAISEMDLVVEISSRPGEEQTQPQGSMNLCLVIDRSGSMGGTKLDTAKKSCIDIFRRLGPGDLLTVVTFDNDVAVIINPQTPKGEVEARINAIVSGSSTNLSLGWYQGLLELQTHMTESHYNRLFLLSDGQANAGETKRSVFSDTATRARDVGITASTIGIGSDFQEDLLEAIASSSGGRFWNISESDIEDIIEEEFEGARTVIIDRPRVSISLPSGVRVSKELNRLRKVSQRYRIRPLQGEDIFNFAIRLEIDPDQATGDQLTIGGTLFDGERTITSAELNLVLGTRQEVAASAVHPFVRSVVQQYETTESGETMLEDLDAGNITEMRQMLTAEIAKLREVESQLGPVGSMGPSRVAAEIAHLIHNLGNKEVTTLILDLVEPHKGDDGVIAFLRVNLRKGMRHEAHRFDERHLGVTPWDNEAPLVLEAIALADQLIAKYPGDATRLHEIREKLREYLEHN